MHTPNIVPYQSFQARDAWFVVAVGNDRQFEKLCQVIGNWGLVHDGRFATNAGRVENREELIDVLKPTFLEKTASEWLSALEMAGIPCGPINTLDQGLRRCRRCKRVRCLIEMDHPTIGELPLVGSPLKFSETPVEYKLPPPRLGSIQKRC